MSYLPKTTIYYYKSPTGLNPVKDLLDSLPENQQTKILRVFQYIESYGLLAPPPHVKKLTATPFWEIRVLGKNNIRVIYATVKADTVLMLHGFIKKTNKTPQKELKTAMHRYQEWLDR